MIVAIRKFSEDRTKIDWSHDDASASDILVNSLSHGLNMDGIDKTILIVECSTCGAQSCYPMSGGEIAQTLHRNHLEQDTLENVQVDATARSIETSGKTKNELIALIIQDECIQKGTTYLL